MTEWLGGLAVAFIGWAGSVEFRLGQVLKMQSDVTASREKIDSLYEHLVEKALADKPQERPEKR